MLNKLFVGGLSFDTTEEELVEKLSEQGPIQSIRLVMDALTGKSKGYAFVTYINEEAAKSAITNLDNTEFGGRRIGVKRAIDRQYRN